MTPAQLEQIKHELADLFNRHELPDEETVSVLLMLAALLYLQLPDYLLPGFSSTANVSLEQALAQALGHRPPRPACACGAPSEHLIGHNEAGRAFWSCRLCYAALLERVGRGRT